MIPFQTRTTYAASWQYVHGEACYRGQVAEYYGQSFVRAIWVCEHQHPTRLSATQCAEAHMTEQKDRKPAARICPNCGMAESREAFECMWPCVHCHQPFPQEAR